MAAESMATTTRSSRTGVADDGGTRKEPFSSSWRRAHLTVDQRVARGKAVQVVQEMPHPAIEFVFVPAGAVRRDETIRQGRMNRW